MIEKRNVIEAEVTPDQSIGVDDELVKQAVAVFGKPAPVKPESEAGETEDARSDHS